MLVIRSTVLLSSVVTVLFSNFHLNSCGTIAFQNNVDTRCINAPRLVLSGRRNIHRGVLRGNDSNHHHALRIVT